MPATLPISRLINVSVNLAPPAAQSQNLSSMLILGGSQVIDVVQRMRAYNTLAAVVTDFGTNAPEYLAANLWFQQTPQPTQLLIGKWASNPTPGQLIGAPLAAPNNLLATWTAIVNGSFKIQIDALALQSLTALNFSAALSLNGVAAIINGILVGAVMAYDAVNNRFVVTSNTTGVASIVSFATAGVGGTDISAKLGLLGGGGGYQANGIVAETALAAVTLFDQQFGQQWYGLVVPNAVDADHQAIAAYIEAATTFHIYGVTTSNVGVFNPGDVNSIPFLLKASGYNRSVVQYSSMPLQQGAVYAVVSLLARILTTDWTGNKTAITLEYKQEPGVTAETLTATQIGILESKNCNVFVAYNNNTAIIEPAVCSSGQFIDTIVGTAAFAVGIQTAVYNALFTSTTKIPQTDAGMHILATAIEQQCIQFENDGLLAPGTWTSGGFGALNTGDPMPKGYYIFVPPVSTQSAASRAARLAAPIQVAGKLAGAVHSANVAVTVNA